MIEPDKKIEFLVKKYGRKIKAITAGHDPYEIINDLIDSINRKYYEWIVSKYANGKLYYEDIDDVKHLLKIFDNIKHSLPDKNLNNISSLQDLKTLITTTPVIPTKKVQKKILKKDGLEDFLYGPGCRIAKILTKEAGISYGRGTKWCTTEDSSFFDFYTGSDDIYIILLDGGRKFQFHYASEELRNEQDKQITPEEIELLSSYPIYKTFLDLMIERYYYENEK